MFIFRVLGDFLERPWDDKENSLRPFVIFRRRNLTRIPTVPATTLDGSKNGSLEGHGTYGTLSVLEIIY